MSETESKPYYKIGEVCELTGTQPYVLRFWESEFPTLAPEKNRSGQRIYRQRDIELIRRIKLLLYEKEYTIAGARKVLESDIWDEEEGLLPDSAAWRRSGSARASLLPAPWRPAGRAPPGKPVIPRAGAGPVPRSGPSRRSSSRTTRAPTIISRRR